MSKHTRRGSRGFTLVELLVVVAIIALLIAALLPAFGKVKTQAKVTQTVAMFSALTQGIQSFQAEQALGGSLPPSSSDNPDKAKRQTIANPKRTKASGNPEVDIAGAHLLVQALVGADGLGSPGFRDANRDGVWWNDTHDKECKSDGASADAGLYGLNSTTGQPCFPRYGAPGYVDDKMRDRLESIDDLKKEGKILNVAAVDSNPKLATKEPLFMDAFDMPVLYYRANRAGLSIVGSDKVPGVFWQEDNAIITGSIKGAFEQVGLDFGAGKITDYDGYHEIKDATPPTLGGGAPSDLVTTIQRDAAWNHTFARFILDRKVTVKPTAVNADSYLLISAGPDSRYGTEDDITNWSRADNK